MMNERIRPEVGLKTDLIGDITFGPFSDPDMKAILRKFGKTAFERTSACDEFGSFLKDITSWFHDPHPSEMVCIEIGTYYGITAALLSRIFGRVLCVSVDLEADKTMKKKIVEHLGIRNISFYDVKNNAEKAAVIRGMGFDFCYMDGDHTNDTQSDFALVKRCGRVLFHEYWPLQPAVWNLVNALPKNEVTRAQFDCLAYWGRK